ncbi:hypothetical protein BCR33DRAFT_718957 [Rhizoclosmatium globosum]|uniref:Uncharacterized protein n=1 Tax=Rhizoclosmatium globosum TaxID=329046 RepID=A0A1Y2C2S0_9FUNG|nr:hypothetical protein BCR33DRAFT_718957 [Rhizoclosmatium globosum]|eukprot:ORY41342.1 hypothetical protein BCR33DRAFT_718957 [Rhizoclosmatium globosum]
MRFHQAMLDHISADKARLVPALPQRPTLNMALLSNPKLMKENMDLLQQNLDSYLKQVIEYGFVDALSLFLLPPGMDTSSMTVSDYVPPPLSRSVESSRLSQQLMVASPDENSQDTFTTAPNTVDGSAPAAEPQYIAPASIRHHASTIPHPQRGSHNLRNSTTNQFSNIMDPNRTSLTNSDKHNSSTNDPRHSSLLSDTRASFQSMNPMDFRNSIGDLTQHQRDSLNSRHGSIISRASHRFSISSRRGSAMVSVLTMDLDTNVASSAKEVTDLPPKAPITQFGAGGPVKSSSVDEQDEDEDEEPTHEETEEEIKKRLHRNFVITGLASALEGMAINAHVGGGGGAGAALKPPTRVGSANTSRRGSDAGHPHPPPRTSSRQVNMNGAADPKMLTQEANVINAYFEDEKKPASSTRDLGGLSGRSSSLGWRG